MLTVCTALLMAADPVTNAINTVTNWLIAGITFLVVLKLAPLVLRGKMTQIIAAVAGGVLVLYFATNTGSFNSIGNFLSGIFK